jgi:hypothetical protein
MLVKLNPTYLVLMQGFISGCEIPLDSTEDRIAHFFSYGRKYGREFMAKLREQKPELFQG